MLRPCIFIAEDATDSADAPLGLTCGRWDAHSRQERSNLIERLAGQKIIIDISDYNCLFLHDLRSAIRPLFVTKETGVRQRDFSIPHAFLLAPADIFADRPAFLLRQGTHNSKHYLALGIQSM